MINKTELTSPTPVSQKPHFNLKTTNGYIGN